MADAPIWGQPWDMAPGVRAAMSGRAGGVSVAPYDLLNLGDHVGDAPAAVQVNRQIWQARLAVRPVYLQQVHGVAVRRLMPQDPDGLVADACWTDAPQLACTVLVADCLPVLLCDRRGQWVAAAHAGWRGLAGGVLEALWAALRAQGAQASEVQAWLGPCIGPQAFEVGPEVRDAFVQAHPDDARAFVPQADRYLAHLSDLARARLLRLGVAQVSGNDGSGPWCTVGNDAHFFSHRRDSRRLGHSGRLAASIWRLG